VVKSLPLRPIALQVTIVSIVACLLFLNSKKKDDARWLSDGLVAVWHAPVALADRLPWMQEGRARLAEEGKQDLLLHQQEFRILQSQIQLAVFVSATILLIALPHCNNPQPTSSSTKHSSKPTESSARPPRIMLLAKRSFIC
jgi:hypothetical protein